MYIISAKIQYINNVAEQKGNKLGAVVVIYQLFFGMLPKHLIVCNVMSINLFAYYYYYYYSS